MLQTYAFNGRNQSSVQINVHRVDDGKITVVGSLMAAD